MINPQEPVTPKRLPPVRFDTATGKIEVLLTPDGTIPEEYQSENFVTDEYRPQNYPVYEAPDNYPQYKEEEVIVEGPSEERQLPPSLLNMPLPNEHPGMRGSRGGRRPYQSGYQSSKRGGPHDENRFERGSYRPHNSRPFRGRDPEFGRGRARGRGFDRGMTHGHGFQGGRGRGRGPRRGRGGERF